MRLVVNWRQAFGVLLAALATSCALRAGRDDGHTEQHRAQGKLLVAEPLRVMTYNIRHAGESSLAAIAEVINAQAPDLVGLQEVDENTARSGGADQTGELARRTGLHASFEPALRSFDGGRFGVALLSRYPIVSSEQVALTSFSTGERYIVALMHVEHSELGRIPVAVTHLSYRSDAEREIQAREVAALLAHRPRAILLGDLNATPRSPPYAALVGVLHDGFTRNDESTPYTFPARAPDVKIDHVLVGSCWETGGTSTVDARWQSDHRPLMAGFRPKPAFAGAACDPPPVRRPQVARKPIFELKQADE